MARRPALTLDNLKAAKPGAPAAASREKQSANPKRMAKKHDGRRRGQTLRLNAGAWKQLKILAVEQERTSHDLLIEALNALFRHYGRPPIA
jgi:hypothetical protein